MRLSLLVAFAAASLVGPASASSAPLPIETIPTGASSSPTDIVSAGRFAYFTQTGPNIGRVSQDGTVKFFPSGFTSTSRIAVGPEGTLWFTGVPASGNPNVVGRMAADGSLLPKSSPLQHAPTGLTTGADGNVWVAANIFVGKFAPNGTLLAEYDVHQGNGGFAGDVTAGPDGNIWVAESTLPGATAVGRITPSGTLTTFTGFLGPDCTAGSKPVTCLNTQHLAVGADGKLWYTASKVYDGAVGSFGTITTAGYAIDQLLPLGAQPRDLVAGPDGKMYAVDAARHVLMQIGLFGDISETPIGAYPGGTDLGADGKLWITTPGADAIQRVTIQPRPQTGNLLVGGDGETGLRAMTNVATVPLTGWATSPNFTAAAFNAGTGTGMLWGGPQNARSYARQLVDVSHESAGIDTPNRVATLSARLGGFGGQGDSATVIARFTDASGAVLGTIQTEPVSPADLGGQTGYAMREIKGLMPAGTRFVEVEALALRTAGSSNDAFFDDLSLTLAGLPAPPPGFGAPVGNPSGAGSSGGSSGSSAGGPSAGTGTASGSAAVPGTSGSPSGAARLSGLRLTPRALRPLRAGGPFTTATKGGALLRFTLSKPAAVSLRFERTTTGRRSGRQCVAPAKTKRSAATCTRFVTAGTLSLDRPAGASAVRLTGRVGGRRLPRGQYRLVITTSAGTPSTVQFRVR